MSAERESLESPLTDTERLDFALAHSGFYAWRKSKRHDGLEMITGTQIRTRSEMDAAIAELTESAA